MNAANNEKLQRFEVVNADAVAYLTYEVDDGVIALTHTKVPESMAGRGIAGSLAKTAFDYARSHQLRVKVVCPFVAKWLEKHPEESDIVQTQAPP